MTSYSFLAEAEIPTHINSGNIDFLKSLGRLIKGRAESIYNSFKSGSKGAKIIAGASSAGSSIYSFYLTVINIKMANKLKKIINNFQKPNNISRREATSVFLNIGYEEDNIIKIKEYALDLNDELSSKIVGPAVQIINNRNDENWKQHLIEFLIKQRKKMLLKGGLIHPTMTIVSGVGAYTALKGN